MRFAASNIGLPSFDHVGLLPKLAEFGLQGS